VLCVLAAESSSNGARSMIGKSGVGGYIAGSEYVSALGIGLLPLDAVWQHQPLTELN
jgi:hypothetical protein